MTTVAAAFSAVARDYDAQRRQLVPCFDVFYGAALAALPFPHNAAFDLLDLGAGTGLLAAMVSATWPRARLTLVDVSADMLDQARTRFAGRDDVAFIAADYGRVPLPGRFDAIVSALSIHHLDDTGKRALYARILAALRPGGVFVNAEQVRGVTEAEEARYEDEWRAEARALGATEPALAAAIGRMKFDLTTPLADQMQWLRAAGFAEVRSPFADRRFAVYAGRRPI